MFCYSICNMHLVLDDPYDIDGPLGIKCDFPPEKIQTFIFKSLRKCKFNWEIFRISCPKNVEVIIQFKNAPPPKWKSSHNYIYIVYTQVYFTRLQSIALVYFLILLWSPKSNLFWSPEDKFPRCISNVSLFCKALHINENKKSPLEVWWIQLLDDLLKIWTNKEPWLYKLRKRYCVFLVAVFAFPCPSGRMIRRNICLIGNLANVRIIRLLA